MHKAFLKKLKNREMASGLARLPEGEDTSLLALINDEKLKTGSHSISTDLDQLNQHSELAMPPNQLSPNLLHPLIPQTQNETTECLQAQNTLFRTKLFQIIESYKNPDNSIELQTYFTPPKDPSSPFFVFIHGAGSSAMSFAKLAECLLANDSNVGILLYDLRGHGKSSEATDYSLSSLVDDFNFILTTFTTKYSTTNSIYLVGHSLGGAILSSFVKNISNEEKTRLNIKGICMLDIVEETAVQSLNVMPLFIARRPASFASLTDAISWHLKLLLHNEQSAKLSVPDLLNEDLTWKLDLAITEPYWPTWFQDLSQNFLSFTGPKLLVLSTHEALDKELIIGQMQGKYQLVVFNNNHEVGHFIHEDIPKQLSVCLFDFVKRNESPKKFMEEEMGIYAKWGGKINK